jgi:hypothetical protein
MRAKTKIYSVLSLVIFTTLCIKLFVPEPYINKERENEFWIKKTFSKSKKNIVIGGDSRVYRGISTTQLLYKLPNLSAVNLGYSDGGFNTEYLEFMHERLDTTAENQIMIFGITPHAFLKKCATNKQLKEYQSKTSSEIFSGKHYANFLKHLSPYTPYELFDDSSETYIIDYQKDGYAASDNLNGDFHQTHCISWDTFIKQKVRDSLVGVFIQDIKQFQRQNITIIAFEPPVTAKMKEIENNTSGFNMKSFSKRLKDNGVYWIEVNRNHYESYDGSHIFHKDAEKLSKFLSGEIKLILETK